MRRSVPLRADPRFSLGFAATNARGMRAGAHMRDPARPMLWHRQRPEARALPTQQRGGWHAGIDS
ncbi:hypothetical protein CBM2605_B70119 [Cupriavidus neocaledonicus]|uniref:Uncharacterized protein n=1 Tax=Cupriavidus neocaledonicus TaxID=1040979 RepID=A0ABY1VBG2_9BURK|nr:hypothetical protein CBM2605_B70119 [Cupriavidus neocaledonicus]